MNLSSN